MTTRKRESWRNGLTQYILHVLLERNGASIPNLPEAAAWWEKNRYNDAAPPAELQQPLRLIQHVEDWVETLERRNDADPGAASLRESGSGYHAGEGEPSREIRDLLDEFLLREGSHFLPQWHSGRRLPNEAAFDRLIGRSPAWLDALHMIRIAARGEITTLLTGETGTGKSLVAQVIHDAGETRHKAFIRVPCADLTRDNVTETLMALHHETGGGEADPGSLRGLFAHAGTIYLDGISLLDPEIQPVALRGFEMIETLPPEVQRQRKPRRVIVSSDTPLERLVARNRLRRDLYYRFAIFQIDLPPLRQRREDIGELVNHFVRQHAHNHNRRVPSVSEDAVRKLQRHSWPGNVRELSNVLERAILLAGEVVEMEHIRFDGSGMLSASKGGCDRRIEDLADRIEALGLRMNRAIPELLAAFLLGMDRRRFRTQDLADDLGVAASTARAYISRLVSEGLVQKFGEKKGTTYQAQVQQYLGEPRS